MDLFNKVYRYKILIDLQLNSAPRRSRVFNARRPAAAFRNPVTADFAAKSERVASNLTAGTKFVSARCRSRRPPALAYDFTSLRPVTASRFWK